MAGNLKVGNIESNSGRVIETNDIGSRSMGGGGGSYVFRNKFIDGKFDYWDDGDSFDYSSGIASNYKTSTMSKDVFAYHTGTFSKLTLSPNEIADIPEAVFAKRVNISSITTNAASQVNQILYAEDVRTLAGKTVTLSFYAKANAAKPIVTEIVQNFGDSGSAEVTAIGVTKHTLSTGWVRYTTTFMMPSISGKTIGANSYIRLIFWFSAGSSYTARANTLGEQVGIFDICGVQLEEGSVATAFEVLPMEITRTRIHRYYERMDTTITNNLMFLTNPSMAQRRLQIRYAVNKRVNPILTTVFSTNSTYSVTPYVQNNWIDMFTVTGELSVTTGAVYIALNSWIADARF